MTGPLEGRVALVTGAATRIGAVTARALAAAGARVAIHYRSSGDAARTLCKELGPIHAAVHADLASPDAAERLVGATSDALGPVQLLVNNASAYPAATWDGLAWAGPDGLDATMRTNAWAPFELMRAVARVGSGAVVNLLDTRLADLDRAHLGYHFSKALLREATMAGARSLAPRWRVNAVAPGPILPPVGSGDSGYLDRVGPLMPLRRTPAPGEVADAVLFLLAAPSITGQTIAVDAGRHLKLVEDP